MPRIKIDDGRVRRFLITLSLLLAAGAPAFAQQKLRLFAAGSLTEAMSDMLAQSGLPPEQLAPPVFGPSGLLRERIEAGEAVDVFASADMAQPRRIVARHDGGMVVMFARNRLCALGTADVGLTAENVLDRMLDPAVRLATSTPGADPGGDYAWAVFARAEALRTGSKTVLEGKALKLVGGPETRPLVPGKGPAEGVFLSKSADIMLGYCSGAAAIQREIPDLAAVVLPPGLTVGPAYGLVVLSDSPAASRFALFVMSEKGQSILARHGFQPVALPDAPAASEGDRR